MSIGTFLFIALCVSRITFFGSSVCNGQGAEEVDGIKHGYAWQYSQLLDARHEQDSTYCYYAYSNTSINGNNTIKHLAQIDRCLLSDSSRFAVLGLGLGNEGIHGAADPQAVYNQWKTNMGILIRLAQASDKEVVATNNYSRGDNTPADYDYIKRMNLEMHEWDIPTVNLLGAIDNCAGDGRWAEGYQNGDDIYHPNTAGHTEMMHAWVPSLFDALMAGKAQPVRQTGEGMRLEEGQSIVVTPEDEMHSFTLAFRVKNSSAMPLELQLREGHAPEMPMLPTDTDWHTIVLTHYYAAGKTYVYLDGRKQGTTNGKMLLERITIRGACKVSDLHFWRAGMNADEIAAWQEGKMLRSSLEICCPLNNGKTTNTAQSMNEIKIVKR